MTGKMLWHPGHLPRIRRLDPAVDHHEIYRSMALREFWWDIRLGLNLAFYRTFGVPGIARLLHDTGELTRHAQKRADDTGLMMYELIAHGVDHPRGRQIIKSLNRIHRAYEISDEEYRYVLATFIYVPARWIDRFGRRPLCCHERAAAFHFYRAVGERMHIRDLPTTDAAFEAEFDAFELANFGTEPVAKHLIDATRNLLAQRFPPALRRFAGAASDVLLDEPLRQALAVPRPSRTVRLTVRTLLRARAAYARLRRPADTDFFTPGQPSRAHPGGYEIEDLGPAPLNVVPRR